MIDDSLMFTHQNAANCSPFKLLTEQCLVLAGFQFDYVFDWTILKYQQSQMTSAPPRAMVSTLQLFLLNAVHMRIHVLLFATFLLC